MQIFVGNLDYTSTEEDLAQLFHPYGEIARVRIMTDRDTGRSRGFGFVEMPDATEAQAAINGLQGATLGGRGLSINEARPREDRRPREEDDGRRAHVGKRHGRSRTALCCLDNSRIGRDACGACR